jgi:hypothetical protein
LMVSEAMADPDRPVMRPRHAPASSRGSLTGMAGAVAHPSMAARAAPAARARRA